MFLKYEQVSVLKIPSRDLDNIKFMYFYITRVYDIYIFFMGYFCKYFRKRKYRLHNTHLHIFYIVLHYFVFCSFKTIYLTTYETVRY